jgi:uncharacterized membrane protein SirB2
MTLIEAYTPVKLLHISSVLLSGAVFTFRGVLVQCRSPLGQHLILKRASYFNDTFLLITGVTLMLITHQYPVAQAWLNVKLILLVVYIVLGILALRKARSQNMRALCFIAALSVYLFIISVARSHNPLGVLAGYIQV